MGENLEKTDLLRLYEMAVEEYRFEVRLNWDRTRYYLGLAATILAAGIALLRYSAEAMEFFLVAFVFIVGAIVSWLGRQTVFKGNEYYRNARDHFRALEGLLDLGQLGLRTTSGMRAPATQATPGPSEGPRRGSITWSLAWVLLLLLFVQLGSAGVAGYKAYEVSQPKPVVEKPAPNRLHR